MFLPVLNWGQGPLNLGKIACGLANWENSVKRNKKRDMHNLIMFKCKFDQRTLMAASTITACLTRAYAIIFGSYKYELTRAQARISSQLIGFIT